MRWPTGTDDEKESKESVLSVRLDDDDDDDDDDIYIGNREAFVCSLWTAKHLPTP